MSSQQRNGHRSEDRDRPPEQTDTDTLTKRQVDTDLDHLLPELLVLFYEGVFLLLKLLAPLPQPLVELHHALVARKRVNFSCISLF